jgi:hypothetical protein
MAYYTRTTYYDGGNSPNGQADSLASPLGTLSRLLSRD